MFSVAKEKYLYFIISLRTLINENIFSVGKRVLSDAWALDTAQKPYAWQRLNPEGDRPSARM